ncbi:hypothetical protein ACG7TL_006712 [Trametes sanguinea]
MSDAAATPPGSPRRPSRSLEEPSEFAEEVVTACEAVVERFRHQEIHKADAAAQLFRALKIDEVVEAEELAERESAYKSYFDMLEDVDRELRAATEQSSGVASSQTQRNHGEFRSADVAAHQQQESSGELEAGRVREGDRRSLIERLSDASPSKRSRAEYDDESDDDSSHHGRRERRKRNIDESLFLFVHSSSEDESQLSEDLQRTLVLKENYTRDLAIAKQRVVCSPGCPPVPDSVWLDILANRYVDLDRIFSAVYAVDGDSKSSVKLGDYELTGLPGKPKRHIERHGHWTIAWSLYQHAVLFVYPHLEQELRTYYDQINGFFAAVSEYKAQRVVNLDRAIRGEVRRSNTLLLLAVAEDCGDPEHRAKHVSALTKVAVPPATVASDMSAPLAQHAITSPEPARKRAREDRAPIVANKRPRCFRGFLWERGRCSPVTPLATLSETMNALPSPPVLDPEHDSARETIQAHPHLFRVVTPLKVDVFERLLQSHPNQPPVVSVCQGFREGFWPFADSTLSEFPETWEESSSRMDDEALQFTLQYAAKEEAAGRYSEPFGSDLLPGMFSMPIHAVPKPHSDKLRFINNHSAGKFSLNSMIDKGSVGMRPDNVQDLAHNLLQFRATYGDAPLWLFKSDVANAYRILPMHPLWQLKQVVTINSVRRIDRCCCFGNRGSPDLFCTFMSLLLWIAIHVRDIPCLLAYMDDNFAFESSITLETYAGYSEPVHLPRAQVRLLQLWDEIGVPHTAAKQLFGRSLTITGFFVDAEAMSITLPPDACAELVNAIHLLFIASIFERHGGVHLIKAISWGPDAADLAIFCDACLSGMAFWVPSYSVALVSDCPTAPPGLQDNIFWYEALTVPAALEWAVTSLKPPPERLAIFTDNLNTPPRQAWTYDRLVRERAIALGYVIDKSTRLTYTSHLQSYLTFCKIHCFPIDPTIDTLSFFVVFMCHHIKPDSVDSYLSGICNQLESLYPRRLFNSPPNRKLPLTVEHILLLLDAFPNTSFDNMLFRAILLCGFFGLHRLGKLVHPDRNDLRDWRKTIKRSSVSLFPDNFSYSLPTHKSNPNHHGHQVVISADHPDVNPVQIFAHYLRERDRRFRFQSALWLTSDGNVPSRQWFLSRLRHVLPTSFTGHSLRTGSATYFAARGWSDDRIQALGRWSSEAYRIYIRENPVVLQALLHGRVLQRA